MRNIKSLFILAALFCAQANAALIVGYDVIDGEALNIGGWTSNYTGITSAGNFGDTFNYTGGTGTLADGIIPVSAANNQLFVSANSVNNTSITLFFDQAYFFDQIDIFGAAGDISNNIPGNISGFDVLIGGTTASVSTTGFGGMTTNESPQQFVNDRALFGGTAVDGISASSMTLFNFTIDDSTNANRFNIGEIVVEGRATRVSEPGSLALLLTSLVGFGLLRRRKMA